MAEPFTIEFQFKNKTWTDAGEGLAAFYGMLSQNLDASAHVLAEDLRQFLDNVVTAIAERNSGGWPGGTGEQSLSQRTGRLNEAILGSVQVSGARFADIQGSIGAPGVPYARIQETGGTIKPKNAKFLAIPLPAALTSDGVPILKNPRSWPNTFIIKSKAGNLLICMKIGATIRPLYVLKSSVKIPARLNMKTTLEAGLGYFVERAMDDLVKAVATGVTV